MRPGYFPFVEPGFEIDTRYEYLNPKTGKKEMSKRMEILGAGMIHPNVLREAGINPDEGRTGFAFGMGGLASAVLGKLIDITDIDFVYKLCSFLPLMGLIAYFLPNLSKKEVRS